MGSFRGEPGWLETVEVYKRDVLTRVVGEVKQNALRMVPVDTGNLKDSIYDEIDGDTGRVGATAHYALFVEEGHRVAYREHASVTVGDTTFHSYGEVIYTGEVVPPQPFLRPALYNVKLD